MESVGIVLRRYHYALNKIALIDKQRGRIDAFLSRNVRVMIGSLIKYIVEEKNNKYFIKRITDVDLPFFLAHSDLLFFHHVLEIIYFFVPLGTPSYELFDILIFLYTDPQQKWLQHMRLKKIFLCQLLLSVGFYCESYIIHLVNIRALLLLPIDIIDPESLDLADEKKIDQWLAQCISTHPDISNFKTIHFLTKNRIA